MASSCVPLSAILTLTKTECEEHEREFLHRNGKTYLRPNTIGIKGSKFPA